MELDEANQMLVDFLKTSGTITRKDVEQAFLKVPRHLFVPAEYFNEAYQDYPLPIGNDATISQPAIVANMTELLEPKKTDKVLEIGTGSGWQAAILAQLVKKVYSIEYVPQLAEKANENLKKVGVKNVEIKVGQGKEGWPEKAPFDGIIVTAAAPQIFEAWVDQLNMGGRIVAPIGWMMQTMVKGVKTKQGLMTQRLYDCVFVPMKD